MRFCYVTGERKREAVQKGLVTRLNNHGPRGYSVKPGPKDHKSAAKKAWETRRAKYGQTGGNVLGPKDMRNCRTDSYRTQASVRSKTRWANSDYRERVTKSLNDVGPKIAQTLTDGYKNGTITHWSKTEKRDAIVKKLHDSLRVIRNRRPSRLEKKVIDLCVERLEYTGDGQFWVTLEKRHKNPDFVVRPFRLSKRVVEVFGGLGYFHTREEAVELTAAYQKLGIECLVLFEDESIETMFKKLVDFTNPVFFKSGRIGETPTPFTQGNEDNTEESLGLRIVPDSVETKRLTPELG